MLVCFALESQKKKHLGNDWPRDEQARLVSKSAGMDKEAY